jgi:mono/diheme cytochrome c family protein
VGFSLLGSACRQEMHDQPRLEPYAASAFFADGAAMRPLPEGVVPAGSTDDELFRTGMEGEVLTSRFPLPVDRALLERGRERYDIHCAVCHGCTGGGDGIVVQRGFPAPPSLHSARLREAPVGHFIDVMTNGYGAMYPARARVAPQDRWAIAAYLRVLQVSRRAALSEVPPEERRRLEDES